MNTAKNLLPVLALDVLMRFCTDFGKQHDMSEPFTDGDYTYATNGFVAIRVPAIPSIPDNIEAPDLRGQFFGFEKVQGYVSLPEFDLDDTESCPLCQGFGKLEECPDCDGDANCQTCSGLRQVPSAEGIVCSNCQGTLRDLNFFVPFHQHGLKASNLALINLLPDVEIAIPGTGASQSIYDSVKFRFQGGEGVVMPAFLKDVVEEED